MVVVGIIDTQQQKEAAILFILRNNNYPEGFQTLCFNCNCVKGHHGVLPYELKIEKSFCVFCDNDLIDNQFDEHKQCGYAICKYCATLKASKTLVVTSRQINSKKLSLKYKGDIMKKGGGVCRICGENDLLMLTIDHIHKNGGQERKNKNVGVSFYRKLLKSEFPHNELRVLCYNCNCSDHTYQDRGYPVGEPVQLWRSDNFDWGAQYRG
jgi:hypothetical protein